VARFHPARYNLRGVLAIGPGLRDPPPDRRRHGL